MGAKWKAGASGPEDEPWCERQQFMLITTPM